jgi:hypothetical protein
LANGFEAEEPPKENGAAAGVELGGPPKIEVPLVVELEPKEKGAPPIVERSSGPLPFVCKSLVGLSSILNS